MASKPMMIKDEFTEKYFEEINDHNKDLFNPDKAVLQNSAKRLP